MHRIRRPDESRTERQRGAIRCPHRDAERQADLVPLADRAAHAPVHADPIGY